MENKPNVAGSGPAWLFDIDSLTRTMNYHPNNNKDALVDGKEHDGDIQKSVSPDIHSSSSGAQTRKQGDKTENNNKAKSPVVTITGFKNLNAELEDTNDFSAAGPSNAAIPNLENLSHSDDADAVGTEADINNLESIISVSPIPTTRIHKDHLTSQIIEEPKRVHQALKDPSWIEAMQEELLQFKIQKFWILVDLPYGKRAIGTKWVYRNKKDERGIVIRNKVRLVAQGHTQEEGIDYEEVFAPVKVVKALYGLHQAPRVWYETLATYLLENGFQRGTIDQTLFIKKQQKDILLVQIYVDDIIFGATNKALCQSFEKLMKDKFQMSSTGELTFFLGLQVKQKKDGIFTSQDKYIAEILKKFRLSEGKSASIPIDEEKPLLKDSDYEDVDVHTYSLNAKTLNVNSASALCDKCVLIDKHDTKLYEHVSKTCSWWYPKFTPSGYKWKPKSGKENVNPNLIEIVLFIVNFGYLKHMTGNLKLLINFVEKFLGMVKFRNDKIAPILGYGDLVQGAVTIKRVYYVEGLNHNLFSVGQFCDADLEVAFWKSTCFIRDLKGMIFSQKDIVVGLPKLKFVKDHLCSSYELGKAKQKGALQAVTIKRVYYVEGLNHNLFSVGQFCNADLEVAFRKSTCFIRDLKGNDLLIGSRGTDLDSITLQDTNCLNPICLMAKATSSHAWLWHHRLSHLNFDTINLLSKYDIV
nr:hypothetical protein [Tanacetum cinerariifolium]